MATLQTKWPTLLDHARAMDPDGSIAAVAELLSQTNEVLADMNFVEGNLATGHVVTIRTGLPVATWRRLYGGVQPDKSRREQVTESCGMLEAYNEVDVALADLNGNTSQFRLSEATATIEGMNQSLADTIFYGSTLTNPERFEGFSSRFSSTTAANGENIIKAGGSGSDNRSIWLVVWGPDSCFGIVPKASKAGLTMQDKGQVTTENIDGSNGRAEIYRTYFKLTAGLCVRDWRYVVRICNIDKSDLSATAAAGANLPTLMFEALSRIPNLAMGRAAFYASRDVWTKFQQQVSFLTAASTLQAENVGGQILTTWHGIPLRRVDRLAVDEALVS